MDGMTVSLLLIAIGLVAEMWLRWGGRTERALADWFTFRSCYVDGDYLAPPMVYACYVVSNGVEDMLVPALGYQDALLRAATVFDTLAQNLTCSRYPEGDPFVDSDTGDFRVHGWSEHDPSWELHCDACHKPIHDSAFVLCGGAPVCDQTCAGQLHRRNWNELTAYENLMAAFRSHWPDAVLLYVDLIQVGGVIQPESTVRFQQYAWPGPLTWQFAGGVRGLS